MYLLKAAYSQPHRATSWVFIKSNLTQDEYNTKHAHFTNAIHMNLFRKLVSIMAAYAAHIPPTKILISEQYRQTVIGLVKCFGLRESPV